MTFLLVCSVISLFQIGRADDGVDIFLKAVDYQQNHGTLITGRVSYSMVLTNSGKSEKEINDEIDELAAELDRLFPDTPKEKNRYDATQSVKSKYSSERHIDGTFQFDYSKDRRNPQKARKNPKVRYMKRVPPRSLLIVRRRRPEIFLISADFRG